MPWDPSFRDRRPPTPLMWSNKCERWGDRDSRIRKLGRSGRSPGWWKSPGRSHHLIPVLKPSNLWWVIQKKKKHELQSLRVFGLYPIAIRWCRKACAAWRFVLSGISDNKPSVGDALTVCLTIRHANDLQQTGLWNGTWKLVLLYNKIKKSKYV